MKDIPPPPEPAFSNWCAAQANPPPQCFKAPAADCAALEVWVILLILALIFGAAFVFACFRPR